MKTAVFVICLSLVAVLAAGQVSEQSALFRTIQAEDSLLFNVGFNTCNLQQVETLLSEKFVFFHDKDSISDKASFLNDFRNGLCADPVNYQSRRELFPGSTKVYPLYGKGKLYGAIQLGVHQFFEQQKGRPEKFGSSAQFTHVWLLQNGAWKLSTALSYEHQEKQLTTTGSSVFDTDSAIEKWMAESKVPALGLGIIENGELRQIRVFGTVTKNVPAPYNAIFNVASLTKPVTAITALKLVSLGKWNLDEPLGKYWTDPDIASDPRNKKLTTRLILSHQTGFPNWRRMSKDKKLKFLFAPGTRYQYSGEGFEYLRRALESKFHKPLQQLANELIFQPLKMADTRYTWDKKVDGARFATGYDKDGNAYPIEKKANANAADNLLTTVEDYATFLVSVMNGEGLSRKVFREMTASQVETEKGKHFGLGFEIYDLGGGDYALSHGGADEGARTIFFVLPKTKQGLLIFTNSDTGDALYENLIIHYLGKCGQKIVDIETK